MMDGMMGDGMSMGLMMVFMMLFGLVLLALAVAAVIWVVRSVAGDSSRASPGRDDDAARRELDLRYARGDLTREDYLQRKSDLGS